MRRRRKRTRQARNHGAPPRSGFLPSCSPSPPRSRHRRSRRRRRRARCRHPSRPPARRQHQHRRCPPRGPLRQLSRLRAPRRSSGQVSSRSALTKQARRALWQVVARSRASRHSRRHLGEASALFYLTRSGRVSEARPLAANPSAALPMARAMATGMATAARAWVLAAPSLVAIVSHQPPPAAAAAAATAGAAVVAAAAAARTPVVPWLRRRQRLLPRRPFRRREISCRCLRHRGLRGLRRLTSRPGRRRHHSTRLRTRFMTWLRLSLARMSRQSRGIWARSTHWMRLPTPWPRPTRKLEENRTATSIRRACRQRRGSRRSRRSSRPAAQRMETRPNRGRL